MNQYLSSTYYVLGTLRYFSHNPVKQIIITIPTSKMRKVT